MPYFTAVLARDGRKWRALDVEVEEYEELGELADALREAVYDADDPVLALVEREDAWWAVVRVDGDDDPRVFVSDVAGAGASKFAGLFAISAEEDDDPAGGCGGDLDVFADLGTSEDRLRELCDEEIVPMDAVAEIAEPAGFAEVLDSLR